MVKRIWPVVMILFGATTASALPPDALTADVALGMAQEAMLRCRADGFAVAVKVVDAGNVERAVVRDEGAGNLNIEYAQAKINAVLLTGRPSGSRPGGAPQVIEGAPRGVYGGMIGADGKTGHLLAGIDAGGAVPIRVGADVVGVIGVSGAPSPTRDTACATAGVAKFAERMK